MVTASSASAAPAEPVTQPPPAEPRARDWDESPAEAARFDRWWGDRDTDYDSDED